LDGNLCQINLNAAGIDIGADRHWVSVPVGRDSENVRSFACFTADLYAMADWLKQCCIETVAMESTGVYWIPVFQVLESRGFDVKRMFSRTTSKLYLVAKQMYWIVSGCNSYILTVYYQAHFAQKTKFAFFAVTSDNETI
jgi:hypothetical protein